MVTKHKIAYIILFCLIILTVFFIICELKNKRIELKTKDDIERKDIIINSLENTIESLSEYSGYYVFPKEFILRTMNGNNVFMKDIIKRPTLIIYMDQFQCRKCILDAVKEVQYRFNQEFKDLSPIIFVGNSNLREAKAFLESNKIKFNCYLTNINDSGFLDKMQKASFPYFFLINKNLEVSNIFFPSIITNSFLSKRYFNNIQKYLNEKVIEEITDSSSLKIINPSVNLGNVKMRKKYSITFDIVNQGNRTRYFNAISSSCECVIPHMDLMPLKPDSIRHINIDIIPTSKGEFSKIITLEEKLKESQYVRMWVSGFVE